MMMRCCRMCVRPPADAPRSVLATAIVLTIGLGLGAAAAIFTSSEAALVEPLPYAAPDRLVHLWELRQELDDEARHHTRRSSTGVREPRASSASKATIQHPRRGTGDEARMLRGAEVTAGFFRLLGVRLSTGRDFVGDEGDAAGARVAIVSARFVVPLPWSALDQTITVNGIPRVIVGVLPGTSQFALLQTRTCSSLSSSAINAVRTGLTGQFTWCTTAGSCAVAGCPKRPCGCDGGPGT